MKGILVKTTGEIREAEFGEPMFKTVGKAVGGHIEHVRPRGLEDPYCMVVNEEGRLRGLPVNPIGSYLYGTYDHGEPIVGDIVIMKEGFTDGEPDIVGLDDLDVQQLALLLDDVMQGLDAKEKAALQCG